MQGGKVGRIVPMRSGVEPGSGWGMRWEFRETRNSARKMRALHGGRSRVGADASIHPVPAGAARRTPPAPEGRRKVAGGAARLGEREPPDPCLTKNASTPAAPWRGARSVETPPIPPKSMSHRTFLSPLARPGQTSPPNLRKARWGRTTGPGRGGHRRCHRGWGPARGPRRRPSRCCLCQRWAGGREPGGGRDRARG